MHTNIPTSFLNKELDDVLAGTRTSFTYISVCAGCGKFAPRVRFSDMRHDDDTCTGLVEVEVSDKDHVITCACC
jgi:hypothetical protein